MPASSEALRGDLDGGVPWEAGVSLFFHPLSPLVIEEQRTDSPGERVAGQWVPDAQP